MLQLLAFDVRSALAGLSARGTRGGSTGASLLANVPARGSVGRFAGGSTRRLAAGRGFSIIEVIVIVVILGVLAAVIAPRLLQRVGQSKQAVAKSNAQSLASSMSYYIIDCGMPEPGAVLSVLFERPPNVPETAWKGPYLNNRDALRDPWGNEYVLVVPGLVNVDFDVISYGSDNVMGGEGEAADIVNGKR